MIFALYYIHNQFTFNIVTHKESILFCKFTKNTKNVNFQLNLLYAL